MTQEQWKRAHEVFEEARGLPPERRAAFLDQACAGDRMLRAEVASLLEHAQTAGKDFLQPATQAGETYRAALNDDHRFSDNRSDRSAGKPYPRIEGYHVLRELGQGGMGVVYEARDVRLERIVAVKTILGEFQTASRLELLRREARLAAKLRHPNIVAVHAFVDSSEPPCLVMEWVDGVPLDLAARRMSYREIATLMLKVARAVAYAHEMGVIHRDLKPKNILVDRAGEPRLLDFGLARASLQPQDQSTTVAIKGTPLFMAPEQFLSPADVGPAADTFALGVVLYTLLIGAPPPAPRSSASTTEWASREIPLPRQLKRDVPEALQRICLKACEARSDDRYASVEHLADDLQRFVDDRPVLARPTRYSLLLEERVSAHMEALGEWQAELLITQREADSLQERYFRLLRTESKWVPGARRLRPGPVLVQVGGWLVVISTFLWLGFYWNTLTSTQRVFAVGIPTLIINVAALVLWRRAAELIALLFSVVGTLLMPLFLVVLLFESNLLSTRTMSEHGETFHISVLAYLPDKQIEMLGTWKSGRTERITAPIPSFRDMEESKELLPFDYFSNRQLAAAFWMATLFAIVVVRNRRYALLSATLCVLLVFAYTSTLLLLGMKTWLYGQQFAKVAAFFSPLPICAYCVARRLDRPRLEHLAGPFYALAGIGFIAVLGTLAFDAPKTWWHLRPPSDSGQVDRLDVARELSFFAVGLLLFWIGWYHDRSNTRLRRMWGNLYYKLVPPCLVIPVHLLGFQPIWVLGRLAGSSEEFRLLELGVPILCAMLILVGTALQLRWFTYYGLLHLAVFVVLMTYRHFRHYKLWPVSVVVVGAVAICVGLILERRRMAALRAAT